MASQFTKEGLSSNADGDNTHSGIHKSPNDGSEASKADQIAGKGDPTKGSHQDDDSDSDGLEDISAVSQGSSQGSAASEATFRDYDDDDDDESTLCSDEESDVRATDEEDETDDLNDESESEEEEEDDDEKSEDDDEVETADEEEASSSEDSEDNLVLDDKQFQSRLTSGSENSLSLDIKSVQSRQTPMESVDGGKAEPPEPSAASSDCGGFFFLSN